MSTTHSLYFHLGFVSTITNGDRDVKKLIVGLAIITTLSGCSALNQARDPRLNTVQGVTIENNGSYEVLKSYQKVIAGNIDSNKLKVCIARSISNDDVQLSDSSASFYGAYTGKYYNVDKSTVSRGGEVVSASSSTDTAIVANGTTSYFYNAGLMNVERVVRFTVDIMPVKAGPQFTFSNLKQAQKNTGTVANTGFNPIGSWEGAGPYQTVQALDKVAADISACAKS